jgi:hypothetical protein
MQLIIRVVAAKGAIGFNNAAPDNGMQPDRE